MQIKNIKLKNFRNHLDTEISWADHINIITGPNGAGKTNIIDAIHYLCMSRSFVSTSDQYVVHNDHAFFKIKGDFRGKIRSRFEVTCTYSRGEGKKIFVNEGPLDRFSDLIGMVPVVVLSPADHALTREGPSERRGFMDAFISQISNSYLKQLIEFKRTIKQRNTLLQDFTGSEELLKEYLEPWNRQLVKTGSKIIAQRSVVLDKFQQYLANVYQKITNMAYKPHFEYKTIVEPTDNTEEIESVYSRKLLEKTDYEIEREISTIGPHRDEVVFYLDDIELRKYGSQGQHRLFALALKLAQLFYYSDELDDLPIFLLDDVFGDLDEDRTGILLKALANHAGQVFVTSAAPLPFDKYISFDSDNNQAYTVSNGNVELIKN